MFEAIYRLLYPPPFGACAASGGPNRIEGLFKIDSTDRDPAPPLGNAPPRQLEIDRIGPWLGVSQSTPRESSPARHQKDCRALEDGC